MPTTGEPEAGSQPPPSGDGVGATVPSAAARHRWARLTALNPRLFMVRLFVSGVAVVVTVAVVPGLGFTGWRGGEFAVVALIYAALTAVVKPA